MYPQMQIIIEPLARETKGRDSRQQRIVLYRHGRIKEFENAADLKRFAEKIAKRMSRRAR